MKEKKNELQWLSKLSDKAVEFTFPEIMAKMIATIDSEDYPHITMISSNKAVNNNIVKWGQFTEGLSKKNIYKNPKQGIIFMTAEMPFKFLQVKVDYDYYSTEAEDAVDFNQTDLMRYNVYMRVHKTFYNKIKATRKIRNISLFGIVRGIITNLFGKRRFKTGKIEKRLPDFGMKLFNGPIYPKFIAYLDPEDGYPIIIPCFQARAIEHKKILIPFSQFKNDLEQIPNNSKVAVFSMDFELESIMIKGIYKGKQNGRGVIDIEKVYNTMPPKQGYIFPELDMRKKVTQFPQ